jgi:hypothetical protein
MAYVTLAGQGIPQALVWLQGAHPDLKLGLTDGAGRIMVYGARNGDVLWAQKENASGHVTVYCGQGPAWLELHPSPFNIAVNIVPSFGTKQLDVRALITPTLAGNPFAVVWQITAQQPLTVPLTYDPSIGRYRGLASLDLGGSDQGHLRVHATDTHAHTVVKLVPFRVDKPTEGYPSNLRSDDGVVELPLLADTLSGSPWVVIHEATVDGTPDGLVRVSQPYEILVSTGQSVLSGTAYLHMHYPAGLTGILTSTLGIHRWDEEAQRWVALRGKVDGALNCVSVGLNQLSVFAVFGEPGLPEQRLYLPVILRGR